MARDLGLLPGYTSATFCPNDGIPRSVAAVVLVRAKLKPLFGDNFTYPLTPMFADVPETDSMFPYVRSWRTWGSRPGAS